MGLSVPLRCTPRPQGCRFLLEPHALPLAGQQPVPVAAQVLVFRPHFTPLPPAEHVVGVRGVLAHAVQLLGIGPLRHIVLMLNAGVSLAWR